MSQPYRNTLGHYDEPEPGLWTGSSSLIEKPAAVRAAGELARDSIISSPPNQVSQAQMYDHTVVFLYQQALSLSGSRPQPFSI